MANNNRFPRNGAKLHLPYFFQLHSFEEWLVRLPFWFVCDLKFIASNWHPHIPTQTVTLYSHYMEISQKVRSFFSKLIRLALNTYEPPTCLFVFHFPFSHATRHTIRLPSGGTHKKNIPQWMWWMNCLRYRLLHLS